MKAVRHLLALLASLVQKGKWPLNKLGKPLLGVLRVAPQCVSVVSLILLIFSLKLTLENRREASRFQDSVVRGILRVSEVSEGLKGNLEQLPRSVAGFDSAVLNLKSSVMEQRDSLQASIGLLTRGVVLFSKSLVACDSSLAQVVAATDKQISILKETQKRWEAEISRRPNLYLVADNAHRFQQDSVFMQFKICNEGDQTARIGGIVMFVPINCELVGENWIPAPYDEMYTQYSFTPKDEIVVYFEARPGAASCHWNNHLRFSLRRMGSNALPSMIKYAIYEAKLGMVEGNLTLNETK